MLRIFSALLPRPSSLTLSLHCFRPLCCGTLTKNNGTHERPHRRRERATERKRRAQGRRTKKERISGPFSLSVLSLLHFCGICADRSYVVSLRKRREEEKRQKERTDSEERGEGKWPKCTAHTHTQHTHTHTHSNIDARASTSVYKCRILAKRGRERCKDARIAKLGR